MSVKTGVIGVGAIGRNHARIYAELESSNLVGIYDANTEHAAAVASEFLSQVFDRRSGESRNDGE